MSTTAQESKTESSIARWMVTAGVAAAVIGLLGYGISQASTMQSVAGSTFGIFLILLGTLAAVLGLHAMAVRQR